MGIVPEGAKELPLACTLDASSFEERRDLLQDTFSRWYSSHTQDGRTLHLRFTDSDEAEQRLNEIIRLESQCCPFFGFDLVRANGCLSLTVVVPEGGEDLLSTFVG